MTPDPTRNPRALRFTLRIPPPRPTPPRPTPTMASTATDRRCPICQAGTSLPAHATARRPPAAGLPPPTA